MVGLLFLHIIISSIVRKLFYFLRNMSIRRKPLREGKPFARRRKPPGAGG